MILTKFLGVRMVWSYVSSLSARTMCAVVISLRLGAKPFRIQPSRNASASRTHPIATQPMFSGVARYSTAPRRTDAGSGNTETIAVEVGVTNHADEC